MNWQNNSKIAHESQTDLTILCGYLKCESQSSAVKALVEGDQSTMDAGLEQVIGEVLRTKHKAKYNSQLKLKFIIKYAYNSSLTV